MDAAFVIFPRATSSALALGLVLCVALAASASAASASTPSTNAGRFMSKAQRIWSAAAPYYGKAADSPMPSTRIVGNEHGPRPRTVRLANGTSQAWFTRRNASGLVNGANASREWLIHEWAHVLQKSTLTRWEAEGGAQLFARRVAPHVYGKLGIAFRQPWSRATDGYLNQMNRVLKIHGWKWVMKGQWWGSAP